MKPTMQIWGLWDCEELLSVHLTQTDARDALDEHLASCRCFADDQDIVCAAVEIRAIRLPADPAPVENRNLPASAVQDDAALGREGESPRFPVQAPSHADC
jgi:hypothetical protein